METRELISFFLSVVTNEETNGIFDHYMAIFKGCLNESILKAIIDKFGIFLKLENKGGIIDVDQGKLL